MKVVVCGGSKSVNVTNALKEKLGSSGIDFMPVESLDEIHNRILCGDYFDRIIIMENGWTDDGYDKDDLSIRNRLNKFSSDMQSDSLGRDVSYIFVAKTAEMASIVDEETLGIKNNSELIVKAPDYHFNFFAGLVMCELGRFPKELLYSTIVAEAEKNSSLNNEYLNNNTADEPQEYVDDEIVEDDIIGNYEGGNLGDLVGDDIDEGFDIEELDIEDSEENLFANGGGHTELGDFEDGIKDFPDDIEDFPEDIDNFEDDFGSIEDFEDNSDIPDSFDEIPDDIEEISGDIEEIYQRPTSIDEMEKKEFTTDPSNRPEYWDATKVGFENTDETIDEIPDNIEDFDEIPEFEDSYADEIEEIPEEIEEIPDEDEWVPIPSDETTNNEIDELYKSDEIAETDISDSLYSECGSASIVDDDMYNDNTNEVVEDIIDEEISDEYIEEPKKSKNKRKGKVDTYMDQELDMNNIRQMFNTFASRGNSIVVTGCGGCGTSSIAMNLANTISNLGYTVLLVDMDTVNKAQSYMTEDEYQSVDQSGAAVMSAVNSTSGMQAYLSVVKQGFRLLTMGMSSDTRSAETAFKPEKLLRFLSSAKANHNFVIYDVPFDDLVGPLKQVMMSADNIVITVDASNWGVSKLLIHACNIGDEDVEETLFNRAQLVFNRNCGLKTIFGEKVKKPQDILSIMDRKLNSLIGMDPGYSFRTMSICDIINFDTSFEDGWFNSKQYSDSPKGRKVFIELLNNIVLKK